MILQLYKYDVRLPRNTYITCYVLIRDVHNPMYHFIY
jgi:hypothetical protein